MTSPLFLKPECQIEPLVNNWYAWSLLVAPATAAMTFANHHVKLMKSYVAAPEVHVAAVKNPAMLGGPFMDVPSSRAGEVEALLRRTERDQKRMVDLAQAVQQLNDLLSAEARGGSLTELYARVPAVLHGYVELMYDVNARPSFRLIEPLLYRSPYYDESLQSLAFSLAGGDTRPFVFSTPRLPSEGQLHLPLPFKSEALDALSRMRRTPQPAGFVKEVLGLTPEQEQAFSRFLTDQPPRPQAPKVEPGKLRVRYLGHACLLMETSEITLLVDPLIGYQQGEGITLPEMPDRIDYVLITHSHSDHVVLETLLQLRHRIGTVVVPPSSGNLEDPSLKLMLRQLGFPVREIGELETVEIPGGSITGIPFLGEHGDLNIRSKTAHLVQLGNKRLLCTADSCNLDPSLYDHVHAAVGDVDVLFIGMECEGAPISWMYGSLLLKRLDRKMDTSRRLCGSDGRQALDIVERFRCKQVYVYAMGQEPWLSFITSIRYTEESKPIVESNKLLASCRERNLRAERLLGTQEIPVA